MKTSCSSCGCHFPDEFEDTLRSWCSYWWDNNLYELSKKYKRIVWDWLFSLNVDEIVTKSGIIVNISIGGEKKKYEKNEFEENIKSYKNWPDKKRRQFQKDFFKFIRAMDETKKMKMFTDFYLSTGGKKNYG